MTKAAPRGPTNGACPASGFARSRQPIALAAWFPGDDPTQPCAYHPTVLSAHESAFAMTVHKAQG